MHSSVQARSIAKIREFCLKQFVSISWIAKNTSPPGRHTLLSDFAVMFSHTIYGLSDRTIPLCARGTLEEVGLSAEVE
jgi:hypothetical protein